MNNVHVWEEVELVFEAAGDYENPYVEVEVWVELEGPGFAKRLYGFWDGEKVFRVRLTAIVPGVWKWVSGANVEDGGLVGKRGGFTAEAWGEEGLVENPNRRGTVRATADGRGLEYADGTPFFLLGDTWWAVPTFRYPWFDDDQVRPVGPEMGFKDMIRYRKEQGFNSIAILAALPNWANDGEKSHLKTARGIGIRGAWTDPRTGSAKDMHNSGGRPFEFPGKIPGFEKIFPDIDRINPAYFREFDLKMSFMAEQGFVPFLEAARRDCTQAWQEFYEWPGSYTRYVRYVWSRYQARNVVFSPIHFDWKVYAAHPRDFNEVGNALVQDYGMPPFGQLVSANSNPSSLSHFGGDDEAPWIGLHQTGNKREHEFYWYLTEIFHADPPKPALNGEPYYSGLKLGDQVGAEGNTVEDDRYVRSGMYGSFLSGGFAGHIYGVQGLWGGDVQEGAAVLQWDALEWSSAGYLKHLKTFAFCMGTRFRELVPNSELVCPNKTGPGKGYEGWAFCARTPERDLFMLYFEKGCPQAIVRGARHDSVYEVTWFDVREGVWIEAGEVKADELECVDLPGFPDGEDWGVRLVLKR